MGKMTKTEKLRREAPFRELERVEKDKNTNDASLMKLYAQHANLAIRQNDIGRALRYYETLAGYYRAYDLTSRLLHAQGMMVALEKKQKSILRGRVKKNKEE